jgi:hypothetical protein
MFASRSVGHDADIEIRGKSDGNAGAAGGYRTYDLSLTKGKVWRTKTPYVNELRSLSQNFESGNFSSGMTYNLDIGRLIAHGTLRIGVPECAHDRAQTGAALV